MHFPTGRDKNIISFSQALLRIKIFLPLLPTTVNDKKRPLFDEVVSPPARVTLYFSHSFFTNGITVSNTFLFSAAIPKKTYLDVPPIEAISLILAVKSLWITCSSGVDFRKWTFSTKISFEINILSLINAASSPIRFSALLKVSPSFFINSNSFINYIHKFYCIFIGLF